MDEYEIYSVENYDSNNFDQIYRIIIPGIIKHHDLSDDGKMRLHFRKLQEPGEKIWKSYRNKNIEIDYSDKLMQEAYILRYGALYTLPVKKFLKHHPKFQKKIHNVALYGAGPSPEVISLINNSISHNLNTSINFIDKYEWHHIRNMILSYFEKKKDFNCSFLNHKNDFVDKPNPLNNGPYDLVVFQFSMNEIISQTCDSFGENTNSLEINKIYEYLYEVLIIPILKSLNINGKLVFFDRQYYEYVDNFYNFISQVDSVYECKTSTESELTNKYIRPGILFLYLNDDKKRGLIQSHKIEYKRRIFTLKHLNL